MTLAGLMSMDCGLELAVGGSVWGGLDVGTGVALGGAVGATGSDGDGSAAIAGEVARGATGACWPSSVIAVMPVRATIAATATPMTTCSVVMPPREAAPACGSRGMPQP